MAVSTDLRSCPEAARRVKPQRALRRLRRQGSTATAKERTLTLTTLGFDADDTLWHNESFFRRTGEEILRLLEPWVPRGDLALALLAAERRNIPLYGYGVKGFTLSMMETAITLSDGRVPAQVLGEVMAAGRDLLAHPLELLPQVRETLESLAGAHRLLLITKGDLIHQERKLAASGLAGLFDGVEILSEKDSAAYARIFARHGAAPRQALMVGNSMKSDVLPALEAGAWGVFVPHGTPWELEHAEAPEGHPRYREIASIDRLPELICNLRL
ncbi:HAD family hydrolase [Falsigemmobacter faecalis]|uniref:HAD family hydrolase n=1 Tax=Falsigemmobacter faecalis TaxID=2488730 RepID=A0A3P3DDV3_9RHOB|nr:HAD family hydrolase [Falsigemmobacter faecalis]RRH72495.1 HAD family hydrolase [Falsigemmobacter faecalis]